MKAKMKTRQQTNSHGRVLTAVAIIASMFICSGILLLILSLAVYYLNLTSQIARIIIFVIYAISTFVGGICAGKAFQGKIFLWGLLAGVAYFVILLLVSLIKNQGTPANPAQLPLAAALCIIPAIVGSMFSAVISA